jgi:hypothetical protein
MRRELLEAHGKTAIALDLLEEALDQEAFLVHVFVVLPSATRSAIPRWNNGRAVALGKDRDQRVRVVAFVCDDIGLVHGAEQLGGLGDVVYLAFGDRESNGISKGVHNSMNLCGRSAPGMTDGFGSPFFAPVAS